MKSHRRLSCSGFTLVEMAIVIVVVGIVISIVASVLPSLIASAKIRQARATLEKMDYALLGYLAANGRCPCPDTDNDGLENRIPGTSSPTDDTCSAYVGQIPYATIGLASSLDPWQQPIRYGIYEDLIRTQTSNLCSAAPCTLCLSDFVTDPDSTYLRTNDGTNTTNQGYILASGGPKDLDGTGGFFDGRNANGTILEFDSPNRIINANYDDLVRANAFAFLQGKLCSGTIGSSSSGTVEVPSSGNCSDGVDNDLDGATDCADSGCATDPACAVSALNIATTTIPSGTLNSSYLTTFTATGGTTPYSWSLTDNGGFSDFSINDYTGSLSGTLDQCPGNYTLSIQVDDTTPTESGGPYSDTQTFTLQVTSALIVSCTSTTTTPITWSTPTQVETFTATGAHLGDINWSLNTGGATGFTVSSTSTTDCTLSKTGSTSTGTYTFTLTAVDATCATNTDDLQFDVIVTSSGSSAPGVISGVIDRLTFSTFESYTPQIINVSGDIYAIAARGWMDNGYIHTIDIASDGQIGARLDYADFDNDAETPSMTHVSGDVYVVAFEGAGNRGYVKTLSIDATGQVSNNTIDTLQFINSNCVDPTIIQISSSIYAVAYAGPGGDGYISTIEIAANGAITNSVLYTVEFDNSDGTQPQVIHVSGDIYAIVYRGSGGDGFIKTLSIDSTGTISDPPGLSASETELEFETDNCTAPEIINVSGDIYAIAYQGPDNDGYVTTVQIAATGQITNSIIDTLEFDTDTGITPTIANGSNGIVAIAYQGPDNDGFFCTVSVDSSGQISDSVLDSIEFETDSCYEPSMVAIGGNIFAITYRGPTGNQGVVTTISLQ